MNPRKPTDVEKSELLTCFMSKYSTDGLKEQEGEDVAAMIERAAIAVFDDYITDSLVYVGKVMIVAWVGDPAFTDTYIWERSDEDTAQISEIAGESEFQAGWFTSLELGTIMQALRYAQKANPKKFAW